MESDGRPMVDSTTIFQLIYARSKLRSFMDSTTIFHAYLRAFQITTDTVSVFLSPVVQSLYAKVVWAKSKKTKIPFDAGSAKAGRRIEAIEDDMQAR